MLSLSFFNKLSQEGDQRAAHPLVVIDIIVLEALDLVELGMDVGILRTLRMGNGSLR